MRNQTRNQLNVYRNTIARLNGIHPADTDKKYSVQPSVQQSLETKVQESSEFLKLINIVPVTEQQGERLGLGIAGTLASTTDTSTTDKRLGNETAFYTQERNGRTYTNVYLKNELATFSKWKG